MHHTGTGYLRQSLLEELNSWNGLEDFLLLLGGSGASGGEGEEEEKESESVPLATMHDSYQPYKQLHPILQQPPPPPPPSQLKAKNGNYQQETSKQTQRQQTQRRQRQPSNDDYYKEYNTLRRKYLVPEHEGQHFQNIYPSFLHRVKEFKRTDSPMGDAGKLAYMADYCRVVHNDVDAHGNVRTDDDDVPSDGSNNGSNKDVVGNTLLKQWSHYWNNTDSTFLLQKTPTLDVGFLESIKVLPTLHVIIVRHPMTSNSWGIPLMGRAWLDAFHHTLGLLVDINGSGNGDGGGGGNGNGNGGKPKIEWYAVITYEALIQHRESVMEELLTVIKSGVLRYRQEGGEKGRRHGRHWRRKLKSETAAYNADYESSGVAEEAKERSPHQQQPQLQQRQQPRQRLDNQHEHHRKLHLRSSSNATSYLIPKEKSIAVWKKCLDRPDCRILMDELTSNIFPYFGYVSMSEKEGNGIVPLSSSPGPVMVSEKFGHVLFSSESAALGKVGDSYVGHRPPLELLSKMKKLLDDQSSPTPTSIKPSTDEDKEERYWDLRLSEKGEKVHCQVFNHPTLGGSGGKELDLALVQSQSTYGPSNHSRKEQSIIHVHGLHHTGTGFLRQLLHESLNELYPQSSSMQDSLLPYRGSNQSSADIYKQYFVSENEGQHLQHTYPSFKYRVQEFKRSKSGMKNAGKLAYMADLCSVVNTFDGDTSNSTHDVFRNQGGANSNGNVGDILLRQWMPFWNASSTFLLQKTPTLDVHFLEATKVLPTLHVIIVRHPMTSNSWGVSGASGVWLDAWSHTLGLLAEGKIEWFAVITYEALIQYQDQVVEELMEVVRSGHARLRKQSRRRGLDMATPSSEFVDSLRSDNHRRLHLHSSSVGKSNSVEDSPTSYLVPKQKSIDLWQKCLDNQNCRELLDRVTYDVLPYFGYESADDAELENEENEDEELEVNLDEGGENDLYEAEDVEERRFMTRRRQQMRRKLTTSLSSSPGPVMVSKNFGHVLFSSEGDALRNLKLNRNENANSNNDDGTLDEQSYLGDLPPLELLTKMKDLLP